MRSQPGAAPWVTRDKKFIRPDGAKALLHTVMLLPFLRYQASPFGMPSGLFNKS